VWFVTRSTAIQDRVAEAILDAAASLLARGGEPPGMNDVAAAAGVARATLYRHFPTREQLLQALTATAHDAIASRLVEADLDAVPVPEAIARITRLVAATGSKYAAIIGPARSRAASPAEQQIGTLIQAQLRRGIDDGTFRSDLTIDELVFLFGQLLQATARMTAEHLAGVEKAAALVTSVFLHGTENRQDATAKDRAIRRHADAGPQEHSNQENGNSPDKTQG
jgi:TetR/AcrR family transcriptional regulator, mexCD-oprJ operon repressor